MTLQIEYANDAFTDQRASMRLLTGSDWASVACRRVGFRYSSVAGRCPPFV
jgi:hypothetical protein